MHTAKHKASFPLHFFTLPSSMSRQPGARLLLACAALAVLMGRFIDASSTGTTVPSFRAGVPTRQRLMAAPAPGEGVVEAVAASPPVRLLVVRVGILDRSGKAAFASQCDEGTLKVGGHVYVKAGGGGGLSCPHSFVLLIMPAVSEARGSPIRPPPDPHAHAMHRLVQVIVPKRVQLCGMGAVSCACMVGRGGGLVHVVHR